MSKRALKNPAIEAKQDQHIPNPAPIVTFAGGTRSAIQREEQMTISRSSQGFRVCNGINS
jgi:hypothetical protein